MLKKTILLNILVSINITASEAPKDVSSKKLPTEIRSIDPFYNPANNLITAASYTKSLDGLTILTSVNKHIVSGELTVKAKNCSVVGDIGGSEDVAAENAVIDLLKIRIAAFESTIRPSSSFRQKAHADYLAEKASRSFGPGFLRK